MDDIIKVLIVDDNETTREGTLRLLEYEDNIEIVGFAENGAVAIERVMEHEPRVVLMDINMPVMNGIEATGRLSQEAAWVAVIVVSVQDDAHYMKEAFRAGAVDFVAKPISSTELVQSIGRAYDRVKSIPTPSTAPVDIPREPVKELPGRDGHIVSVLGFKGGVGKTLIAVNLGVALARADKKTVLVDANLLFGDVSVFLNTRSPHSIVDMAHEAAISPDQLDPEYTDQIFAVHESGLSLLIAPANPSDSERITQETMVNILKYLKSQYDYVVIDTSTDLDELMAAIIQTSDRVLVVTTPEMPALKDAKVILNELHAIEFDFNNLMIILNRVSKDARITPEQISRFLGRPITAQIPDDPAVLDSVNQQFPIISVDPRRAPAVGALRNLVQLVRTTFEERQQAASDEEKPGAEKQREQKRRFPW